ncbi:AfsR/SARP family transcriptional regulator [Saccharopolyspora gloriosae]|uniref:AfsR/SARP family transcriptional regulator n=1 Tax=Saccharopolyspora gloriosae TaxID=455344 RepID=UPI001FB66F51|nr:AfsR/SARP family transcriptional regulator [Saccharopolyspora gloriosae]
MNQSLSFNVLGPLSVEIDARPRDIPGARQRILLAALLVRFNQVVPVDELTDRIWGTTPPHRPRRALHTCLTRLRQAMAETDDQDDTALIRTTQGGYMIEVRPENLDLARFTELVDSAHTARGRGDLTGEFRILEQALALWRGRALPDVQSDSLHRDVIPQLHERWVSVLERHGELALKLRRHHEIVGELRALTFEHPFHEPFWQQFMLALYRCGRRIEALMAYADLMVRTREEFGVEPGPRLRELHLAILRDDTTGFETPTDSAPKAAS